MCAAALVSEALQRYATASSCPVTSPVLGDLWCPDALALGVTDSRLSPASLVLGAPPLGDRLASTPTLGCPRAR